MPLFLLPLQCILHCILGAVADHSCTKYVLIAADGSVQRLQGEAGVTGPLCSHQVQEYIYTKSRPADQLVEQEGYDGCTLF